MAASPPRSREERRALLLAMLREARGRTVAYLTLSHALGVGRSAINDYVGRLRFDGHDIQVIWGQGLRAPAAGGVEAAPEPAVAAALQRAEAERPSPRRERRCLCGCRQMFMSEGPGNRIRPECVRFKSRDEYAAPYALGVR